MLSSQGVLGKSGRWIWKGRQNFIMLKTRFCSKISGGDTEGF